MSNDRIWLRCNKCGGGDEDIHGNRHDLLLYKMMGSGLYTPDLAPDRFINWLDSHAACHPQAYGSDLAGVAGFRVLTESDGEFYVKFKQCPHVEWQLVEETRSPVEDRKVEKCVLCGHQRIHTTLLK